MKEGTYSVTPIWGDVIPGNSSRSKLDDMTIDFDADPQKNQIKFALLIGKYLGSVFFDRKKVIDTATWCNCMEPGYCEQTYTDVPGIVPFLCEGSDRAVILIPGGGYAFTGDLTAKDQEETDKLARRLNEHGISAFCLDYRYNPYRVPSPLLDVQRAVRFIRFHAEEYGLDPKKIAL
ncbi:MAG: alpha/beta hydrolase, partial [Clostridia bacterium]|nr:alpha/beta hydrolase [Clostridia bacterium]